MWVLGDAVAGREFEYTQQQKERIRAALKDLTGSHADKQWPPVLSFLERGVNKGLKTRAWKTPGTGEEVARRELQDLRDAAEALLKALEGAGVRASDVLLDTGGLGSKRYGDPQGIGQRSGRYSLVQWMPADAVILGMPSNRPRKTLRGSAQWPTKKQWLARVNHREGYFPLLQVLLEELIVAADPMRVKSAILQKGRPNSRRGTKSANEATEFIRRCCRSYERLTGFLPDYTKRELQEFALAALEPTGLYQPNKSQAGYDRPWSWMTIMSITSRVVRDYRKSLGAGPCGGDLHPSPKLATKWQDALAAFGE